MTGVLYLSALVVAGCAAARSTWSPCGLSMLSSITVFSERARGHRYWPTALWFVVGAIAGGACLGALAAGVAGLVRLAAVGSHPAVVAGLGALVAAVGAGVDAGVFGAVLPLIRRQVDDSWLAKYRPWLYGAGFGWQLGVGVATYLMTAGVVVAVGLAALTGSAMDAVLVGTGFGLARGLTVLLPAGCATPAELRVLHRRLVAATAALRWAAVGAQVLAAGAVLAALVAGGASGEAVGAARATAGGLGGGAVRAVAGGLGSGLAGWGAGGEWVAVLVVAAGLAGPALVATVSLGAGVAATASLHRPERHLAGAGASAGLEPVGARGSDWGQTSSPTSDP